MSKRTVTQRSWILVILGLLAMSTPLFCQFQRFRVSSGSYTISSGGGGGGSINLPARCLDGDLDAPGRNDRFMGASSSIQVTRLRNGKAVGAPRPLSEAMDWVRLSGNGSASSVVAEIVAKDLKQGDSFRIDVSPAGIVGPTQEGVVEAAKFIAARPKIQAAQKRLDDLGFKLEKAFGSTSPVLKAFRDGNADLEWAWLSPTADIPRLLGDRVEDFRQELFGAKNFLLESIMISYDLSIDDISIDGLAELSKDLKGPEVRQDSIPSARLNIKSYKLLKDAYPFDPDVLKNATVSALRYADRFPDALKIARYATVPEFVATVPDLETIFPVAEAKALGSFLGRADKSSAKRSSTPVFLDEFLGTVFAERQGVESIVGIAQLDTAWIQALGDGKRQPLLVVPEAAGALREKLRELKMPFTDLNSWSREQMQLAFETKTISDSDVKRTEIRHFDAALSDALELTVTKMASHGDAILMKCPNDELILVDSGFQKADLARIKENYPGRPIRIRIVITHRDADHLGGLRHMLEDPGFILDEIVVSLDKNPGRTELWTTVLSLLQAKGYKALEGSRTLAHFVTTERKVEPAFRSISKGDLERWTINPLGGLSFDLYRLQSAETSNDSSIVMRVTHKGKSFVLSSDASPKVMKALNDELMPGELSSGFLKWPHHRWIPATAAERATVSEFIQMVNPHTIVISNSGAKQPLENVEKIRRLIHETLGKDVKVHSTADDGDIRLIALVNLNGIGFAGEEPEIIWE